MNENCHRGKKMGCSEHEWEGRKELLVHVVVVHVMDNKKPGSH